MILSANNESKTNFLEFEELTDLELESVAGGGKKERREKRKRKRALERLKKLIRDRRLLIYKSLIDPPI